MSELGEAIEALRTAVVEGTPGPDGAATAGAPVLGDHEVTLVPGTSDLDNVVVTPRGPVRVSELEKEFGPARPLPRRPSGGMTRTVVFDRTLPDEGTSGATVLAEVGEDGFVARLIVRLDRY